MALGVREGRNPSKYFFPWQMKCGDYDTEKARETLEKELAWILGKYDARVDINGITYLL